MCPTGQAACPDTGRRCARRLAEGVLRGLGVVAAPARQPVPRRLPCRGHLGMRRRLVLGRLARRPARWPDGPALQPEGAVLGQGPAVAAPPLLSEHDPSWMSRPALTAGPTSPALADLTSLSRPLQPEPGTARSGRACQRGERLAALQILFAGLRAAPPASAVGHQLDAGPADPADPPGRYPGDQRVIRNVLGHYGRRSDQRP